MVFDFTIFRDYITLENPVKFDGFEAIGWFPYHAASVSTTNINDGCSPPRKLFSHIEEVLQKHGINDNKIVVIFKDTEHFGTDDFAIQFHDLKARIGSWDNVRGYGGGTLPLRTGQDLYHQKFIIINQTKT